MYKTGRGRVLPATEKGVGVLLTFQSHASVYRGYYVGVHQTKKIFKMSGRMDMPGHLTKSGFGSVISLHVTLRKLGIPAVYSPYSLNIGISEDHWVSNG